jgi:hypothetical protein
MTLKSIELLLHIVIVYFYSPILSVYTNGVRQILVKLELFFLTGNRTF